MGCDVLVVLDNFRIGGIQRLALDQLYILRDLKIPAEAHYREVKLTKSLPNFLDVESSRISEEDIKIVGLPESDWSQLRHFIKFFRENEVRIVINHSVGGTIILWLASLLAGRSILIKTFVHQLPTLSATQQRLKRFFCATFSTELYGYSVAVTKDWNARIQNRLIPAWIRQRLQMRLQRNGIYLKRLPNLNSKTEAGEKRIRVIFLGRSVGWKNVEKVFSLLRHKSSIDIAALIILPAVDEEMKKSAEEEFSHRIEFKIGQKIEDIEFRKNNVNLYPVDYGPGANFVEAISLNCLEMACLGIPSLIASKGSETWPELLEMGLLNEVDWSAEDEVLSAIQEAAKSTFSEQVICKVHKLVSIENNIIQILDL